MKGSTVYIVIHWTSKTTSLYKVVVESITDKEIVASKFCYERDGKFTGWDNNGGLFPFSRISALWKEVK